MNVVEDYAKLWAKRENEELETLSEWVKSISGILQSRIRKIETTSSCLRFHQFVASSTLAGPSKTMGNPL
jgi:hypothetical protein